MKRTLVVVSTIGIMLSGCGPTPTPTPTPIPNPNPNTCPRDWICLSPGVYTSQVGAWYSIQAVRSADGVDPADTSKSPWGWSRYKPDLGYYDSSSQDVIDTHFAQMRSVGIDFLIIDNTNGIAPTPDSRVWVGTEAVVRESTRLGSPGGLPYAIAIGSWLRQQSSQTQADYVFTQYAQNPAYFRWNGKPLIISYNGYESQDVMNPDWTDPRFSVGRSPAYVLLDNDLPLRFGGSWWGWAWDYPQFASAEVVTVCPGFNNKHRPDGIGMVDIDRHDGRLFQWEWLRAIKKNPKAIIIASFNEFESDETAIEPAQALGPVKGGPAWPAHDWYLQIAAGYGNLRKGLVAGMYYRDEDDSTVYQVVSGTLRPQSSVPSTRPVILVPSGTLRKVLGPRTTPTNVPDGTLMIASGLPPALIIDKSLLMFESLEAVNMFARSTLHVDAAFYWSFPYAGAIHRKDPVYGTAGYPPAFESDRGELWPVSCLEAITANGSSITTISPGHYGEFVGRSALMCK